MSDTLLTGIYALLNEHEDTLEPSMVPILRRLDGVEPEPIHWLWEGWLARGKLAILGGHPGDGKSTLSLALAGMISAGAVMPDGAVPEPTSVLILPAEDGAEDTIVPRLRDHGADLTRCFVLDEVPDPNAKDPGHTRPVNLIRDLPIIESAIRSNEIGLLIVDPVTTFLPRADRNSEGDVRDAMHPVLKMLTRTGCAGLGIMHLGKAGPAGRRPLQQLLGSTAFGAIARTVWMIAPDPSEPTNEDAPKNMILGVVKANLSMKPKALTWSRGLDQPLQWHGVASIGIDEAMSFVPDVQSGADSDAIRFLRSELQDGPVASVELFERAKAESISKSQLRTASKHLGVKPNKESGTATGRWYWELPTSTGAEHTLLSSVRIDRRKRRVSQN